MLNILELFNAVQNSVIRCVEKDILLGDLEKKIRNHNTNASIQVTKLWLFDGNMKNQCEVCKAKYVGYPGFLRKIKTGCTETPKYNSCYWSNHTLYAVNSTHKSAADSNRIAEVVLATKYQTFYQVGGDHNIFKTVEWHIYIFTCMYISRFFGLDALKRKLLGKCWTQQLLIILRRGYNHGYIA